MKKTRKILSLTLVFLLLTSVFVCPACVAASEDTREVLELVKSRIPDTSGFSEFESSVRETAGIAQYYFNWSSDDKDGYKSMNITAAADGIITSYYSYDASLEKNKSNKLTINKLSSDEALIYAQKLVNKLNPALEGHLQLTKNNAYETLSDDGYSFEIQRTENNIPVYGDNGHVTISSDCERIDSFNLNYSQGLSFADYTDIITPEAAMKSYSDKIGMELVYKTSYESDNASTYLAYVPGEEGVYIDAISGEAVTPITVSQYRYASPASKNEAAADTAAGEIFSAAELSELEQLAGLMSFEEIDGIIKANKYINVTAKMTPQSKFISQKRDGEYIYNIEYEQDSHYCNVTVNASTGEIISVYQSADYADGEVSASSAKEIAGYFAPARYCEDEKGEYRFCEQSGNSFEFVRYINDIPYYDNTLRISINPADGQLMSYSLNHRSDVEFMPPDSVLSADDCCVKLFNQVDYSVYYYPCASAEGTKYNDTAKLLYMTEPDVNCTVYADSGKLVFDYNSFRVGDYSDISGHYAEEIINTLARFGIGFDTDSFLPDEIITQKDFVALLTSVISGNSGVIISKGFEYDNIYNRARSRGIIKTDEENPDANVTRETACVYMIRAIGLEAAAELDSIYVPQFEDVSKNIGYISILSAMGVVNGYNGFFNPGLSLTRADAMIMIYNYLK